MLQTLRNGSVGQDVRLLQKALNEHPPSTYPPLSVDGIFGPKTLARVKEFQRRKSLTVDGIVGPKTWAALKPSDPANVPPMQGCNCGTCDPGNNGLGVSVKALFQTTNFSGAAGGVALAAAPTSNPIRMLDAAQQVTANRVFGGSLDFSRIFITNKAGLQNRPFTIAFPDSNQIVQIMNLGTFKPSENLLIHELTHVWQSQHHSNPFQFMKNAVASQGIAVVANGKEIFSDPDVVLHHEYPVNYPLSAYAYLPGQSFASYAAEQMAQACELRESNVRAKLASISRNVVDGDTVTALRSAKIGDRRIKGVKC